MERPASLTEASRKLTRASAVAFALVGIVLFVAPKWVAPRFAWSVSDLVTMTIGGWCIGSAFIAWRAARDWRWSSMHGLAVYLWSFAVSEVAVLAIFADKIPFGEVMTWPYLAMFGVALVAAIKGALDWIRLRPAAVQPDEPRARAAIRAIALIFVLLVGFLALRALLDPDAGRAANIFPEPLSRFTVSAFGVFYLAIALGAVPLIFARSLTPTLAYTRAGMGLIVPITVAGFVYIGRFDFSEEPLQLLYLGAYVGVFIAAALLLWWARRTDLPPVGKGAGSSRLASAGEA